jgi:hypothetical protein
VCLGVRGNFPVFGAFALSLPQPLWRFFIFTSSDAVRARSARSACYRFLSAAQSHRSGRIQGSGTEATADDQADAGAASRSLDGQRSASHPPRYGRLHPRMDAKARQQRSVTNPPFCGARSPPPTWTSSPDWLTCTSSQGWCGPRHLWLLAWACCLP